MTLLDVLLAIAIIGVLFQLTLPAVESSREASRRSVCLNNLRNIGLAMRLHESSLGQLPTGGWGWAWMGDPDRGTGKDQPGSWAYQLLPYLDQQVVYDISRGLTGNGKYEAIAELASTPVPLYYCPSRRLARATPNNYGPVEHPDFARGNLFWYNSIRPESLARTDYAANLGDEYIMWRSGPPPIQAEAGKGFLDFFEIDGVSHVSLEMATGVVVQRHPFHLGEITDGASKTYFAGEKMMFASFYKSGTSLNDDQSCWNGDDLDTVCSTLFWPQRDRPDEVPNLGNPFGGPHPTAFNMAYCDGSVRSMNYDMDPQVHRVSGNRNDSDLPKEPVPSPE